MSLYFKLVKTFETAIIQIGMKGKEKEDLSKK